MLGLTPYHWLVGLATLLGMLGVLLRWYHRREATAHKTETLSNRMNKLEGKIETQSQNMHLLELKLVEHYIHRDDFVVAITRIDHKIDKIIEHLSGVTAQ